MEMVAAPRSLTTRILERDANSPTMIEYAPVATAKPNRPCSTRARTASRYVFSMMIPGRPNIVRLGARPCGRSALGQAIPPTRRSGKDPSAQARLVHKISNPPGHIQHHLDDPILKQP